MINRDPMVGAERSDYKTGVHPAAHGTEYNVVYAELEKQDEVAASGQTPSDIAHYNDIAKMNAFREMGGRAD